MGAGASCNTSLHTAGLDVGVIPDCNDLIGSEGPLHDLGSFQPFAILMTVADEDLGAIWGSREVPLFLTAEKQLMCWGMPFRGRFYQTSGREAIKPSARCGSSGDA